MKQLNQLQKNYLLTLLEFMTDYKTFDDLGVSEILALRVMCGDKDDENLNTLVNKFIKQYNKNNEANQWKKAK